MAADGTDDQERERRPSPRNTAERTDRPQGGDRRGGGEDRHDRRVSARRAMRHAAEQLEELLGRTPESVSAVKPTRDGWQADVEVLELERIPETSSVMASYRVTLDEEGELMGYEQIRRYTRGQVDRRT
ncbi:MAG TPA: gas vesicle protein [Streptomyces sp.]|nr:gas vesicle protein [Streptomyces sp.]